MRTWLLFGAALAAGLLLSTRNALSLDAPRPLSGRELQMLLLGNTLIGLDQDGVYWMYYPSADTVWGRSTSGDVDVGRWWVENDSYCRTWRRWHDGQTRCWQMAYTGADELLWYTLRGEKEGRSFIRQGNAIGDVPQDAVPGSQLADAGSGLSSALEAVVARAEIGPEDGLAAPGRRAAGSANEAERTSARGEQDGRGQAGGNSPFIPRGQVAKKSVSPRDDDEAAPEAAAPGKTEAEPEPPTRQSRINGMLERIGVRKAPAPAPAPAEAPAEKKGKGRGGEARGEGKAGSDRDHG